MIAEERRHSERDSGGAAGLTALVARWRSGDLAAFREVVHRFQAPLLSYVTSVLRNLQDAEDVVQDTWLRAHRSVGQIEHPAALWGWLKRIAHNGAVDAAKQARRRAQPTDPEHLEEIGDAAAPGGHAEAPPVVPSLEMITSAIESLPEIYREPAIYFFLQEWPYTRIAETLGIEPATARQRISRGGRMLRSALRRIQESECHDM